MSRLERRRLPRRRRILQCIALATGLSVLTGCGTVYDLPLPGGADVGDDPLTVHVRFNDVLDLVPKSTVKVNDVTVGKVSAVDLKGYTADVTLKLPKDTDLPDNARAEIRQTSLLGEKFVSLSAPDDPEGKLSSGDVIPLSRSGRNPEVEEVLGALSLLLNGGGVAQLRSIARELNTAVGGREDEVRDLLEQLRVFTGQLDQDKAKIVGAIESLNRLAVAAKKQTSTIELTLDELPSAIASINTQRADLVKTLTALDNLSDVGVRVIKETKANTITTINDLAPVLDKLADAGSAFPKSIQIQLTFPFVDEAVGRNPVIARNLHFGDYVNLDATLNIDKTFLSGGCKLVVSTLTSALKGSGLTDNQVGQTITQLFSQIGTTGCDRFAKSTDGLLDLLTPIINGLGLDTTQVGEVITKLTSALTPEALTDPLTAPATQSPQPQSGLAQQRRTNNGGGLLGGEIFGDQDQQATPKSRGGSGSSSDESGSSGGSSSGSSGGLLGGLFSGMGRAATGFDLRDGNGKQGDALNGPVGATSDIGYNSTLGALLLQGVDAK